MICCRVGIATSTFALAEQSSRFSSDDDEHKTEETRFKRGKGKWWVYERTFLKANTSSDTKKERKKDLIHA